MTKVSDYPTLGHLFFDESIRLDTIIWIAACADQPPESLERFLEDEDFKTIKRTLGLKKSQLEDEGGTPVSPEEVVSALARARRQGFLVHASTPVPVAFHEDGYSTHGFGYCRVEWFYTEDLRDAQFAQRLLDWKARVVADARKKLEQLEQAKAEKGGVA